MQVMVLTPLQYPRLRKRILRFVKIYRDLHITREARERLSALKASELAIRGNLVVVALEGNRLVGVLAATEHGQEFSLAVVNRRERSRGVGKALLHQTLRQLGSFHVEIASDNIPSLKLAFACGMVGYDVFARETGKVVLRLQYPCPMQDT